MLDLEGRGSAFVFLPIHLLSVLLDFSSRGVIGSDENSDDFPYVLCYGKWIFAEFHI